MPRTGRIQRLSLQWAIAAAVSLIALVIASIAAHAAGSGMPWEAPLQRILESIEGPVAKVSAVVIIILTGLSLAFGDMGRRHPPAGADRVRALDRVRRHLVLPHFLLLRRRAR
jgi:type IV secretory pathway VirB2 component (pilin)